jgi:hypothetical protein
VQFVLFIVLIKPGTACSPSANAVVLPVTPALLEVRLEITELDQTLVAATATKIAAAIAADVKPKN